MEHLPALKLHRPATAAEAVALFAGESNPRYLAGGTDMVVNIRRGIEAPESLIDLAAIEGFDAIGEHGTGVVIGAGATLAAIAAHDRLRRDYGAVAEAAESVAGPTHRVYATLGGNLCLDTRCIYYNQSEWWRRSNAYCLKHRGEVCHVAPNGRFCFAAFSGDLAPALIVHEAEIEILGPGGTRRIAVADLYANDGMDHLRLARGELVVAAHLPSSTAGLPSAYAKSRVRGAIDFPLAGVALALRSNVGMAEDLRVAVTAVDPHPHAIAEAGALVGRPIDAAWMSALRETVRAHSKPMRTTTTRPWYRRRVVGALAVKLATRLGERGRSRPTSS